VASFFWLGLIGNFLQCSLAQQIELSRPNQLVTEGLDLAQQSRFSEAIDKFNLALEQNSQDGRIYLHLANGYLKLADFGSAEIACQRAGEFLQTAEVYATMGQIQHRKGKLINAREQYCRAVEIDPKVAQYHNRLAQIYHSLGQFKLAEGEYQAALKINSDMPSIYHNLGEIYHLQGQIDKAIMAYQKSLSLADSAKSSAVLSTQKRLKEALNKKQSFIDKEILRLQLSVVSDVPTATKYRQLALAYYAGRQFVETIESLQVAQELAPKSKQIQKDIETLQQQKRESLMTVLASLKSRLKRDPTNPELLYDIGLIFVNLEQSEKAESHFRAALKIAPQTARIWLQLGLLLKNEKQMNSAQKAFLNSIKFGPTVWSAHHNLALVEIENGKVSSAEKYLQQAKSILHTELSKNNQRSSTPLRSALSQVNFHSGKVYIRLKQNTKAIIAYHTAIRLKPDSPSPYFELAKLYFQMGNKVTAASFFDRFLKLAWPRKKWEPETALGEKILLQTLSSERIDP